jgi:hypothetical protein
MGMERGLTLRDEHTLMMFDVCYNRCLRVRDELTGEWRRLHNEKLYSGDYIKKNKTGGVCGSRGRRNVRIGFWWGET